MSKSERNIRQIKGISSLGRKQRAYFKQFLAANPDLLRRVYKLKELNMADVVAAWLDGINYGKLSKSKKAK